MRAFAIALVVVGCQAPPPEAPGASCVPAANAARARVREVAEANRACTTDADCVHVPIHTTCFHDCELAVNQTGKGAVERAAILVEAHECRIFRDDACVLAEAECAAPGAPACRAGTCR